MFTPDGDHGQAAVAIEDSGQALGQLCLAVAGTEGRRLAVTMDVNEAGGQVTTRRIHYIGRLTARQIANGGDFSVCDGNVRRKDIFSSAVHHSGISDQIFVHDACLLAIFFYFTICPFGLQWKRANPQKKQR